VNVVIDPELEYTVVECRARQGFHRWSEEDRRSGR
jgi:hypothetical protein